MTQHTHSLSAENNSTNNAPNHAPSNNAPNMADMIDLYLDANATTPVLPIAQAAA
jgi:hypothetical protein